MDLLLVFMLSPAVIFLLLALFPNLRHSLYEAGQKCQASGVVHPASRSNMKQSLFRVILTFCFLVLVTLYEAWFVSLLLGQKESSEVYRRGIRLTQVSQATPCFAVPKILSSRENLPPTHNTSVTSICSEFSSLGACSVSDFDPKPFYTAEETEYKYDMYRVPAAVLIVGCNNSTFSLGDWHCRTEKSLEANAVSDMHSHLIPFQLSIWASAYRHSPTPAWVGFEGFFALFCSSLLVSSSLWAFLYRAEILNFLKLLFNRFLSHFPFLRGNNAHNEAPQRRGHLRPSLLETGPSRSLGNRGISKPSTSFFAQVLVMLAEEQGLKLSEDDLNLFMCLEGVEKFRSGDCFAQMQTAGICVEVPKDSELPPLLADVAEFKYGPQHRTVRFVPEKLTALGLSVLFWILVPDPHLKPALMNVIRRTKFSNCFVEHVDGKRAGAGKYVVLPTGWLYEFEIPNSFVLKHGESADMAVMLGYIPNQTATEAEQHTGMKRHRSAVKSSFNLKKLFRRLDTRPGPGSPELYLNENYRLVFEVIPSRTFEIAGGSVNANAAFLGFEVPVTRTLEHQEARRRRCASHMVIFVSLSHFLRHHLQGCAESALLRRMEWFREALLEKCVFPKGENIGFLKAFTGRCYKDPKVCMFPEYEDCRVDRDVLIDFYDAKEIKGEDGESVFVYLDNDIGSRDFYSAKCHEGSDLWVVNGTFQREEVPDRAVPLQRDVG